MRWRSFTLATNTEEMNAKANLDGAENGGGGCEGGNSGIVLGRRADPRNFESESGFQREGGTFDEQKPIIFRLPSHIPHPCHIPHSTPLLKLHYMQRAEHLRDVYVRAQMWKAV